MKKLKTLTASLKPCLKNSCLLFLLFCIPRLSFAQTGVLDITFGSKGKVSTVVSDSGSGANAVVLQSDGKIVVVGNATMIRKDAFAVVRYNTDGTLDNSFGNSGKVITTLGQYNDVANAVAIQPDGKIVVAGSSQKRYSLTSWLDMDFAIVRYNTNGNLDSSFGTNGVIITDFELMDDEVFSIAINLQGKILVAGVLQTSMTDDNFGLIQYNSNGSLDSTFGINGKVNTDINATSGDAIHSVIIQKDGKILAGGNANQSPNSDFAVVRYFENGSIDSSFGVNGKVVTDFGGSDYGLTICVQSNGKIVLGGQVSDGLHMSVGLTRFNANGTLDTTFGTNGKVISSLYNNLDGAGTSVHIQPDQKVLVTGATGITNDDGDIESLNFVLLRYNDDGSPDNTFGKKGVIITDFKGFNDLSNASLILPDGKILLAGYSSSNSSHTDFALARYEKNAMQYYNTLKGSVFIDNNSNGTRDIGEQFYNNAKVVTIKQGVDTITTIAHTIRFSLDVDTGSYTTTVQPLVPYYNVVPSSFTTAHSNYFNTDSISFALQPIAGKKDLVISLIPVTAARPGFDVQYRLTWRNQGTEVLDDVTVQLVKHNNLTYVSSSFVPTTTSGDTLRWNFYDIGPFETGNMVINFTVAAPPSVNNGDTLRSVATNFPISDDVTPADNVSSLVQRVTGSYDPNDKTESHGGVIKPEHLTNGEYLTYTIRFQNTGTDTAFNVVVKDTLSTQLDWSTFQMVSYSHGYQLNMNDGKCTWYFNNILLVDSNTNEPASHGYLVFRIKPISTLSVGDTVKNVAGIYFDYNLPVQTNTDKTAIANGVLPIKLLTFTAKRNVKNNVIDWATTHQINFSHFEVERSANARDFKSIGTIPANNSSKYSLNDNQPAKSINYYRLKLVDKDGRFEYSAIRTVNNSGSFYVSIYPNPVKESLNVKIQSEKKETLYLEVIGMDGKILVSKQAAVSSTNVININTKSLSGGFYFLRVKSSTKEQTVLRFEKL